MNESRRLTSHNGRQRKNRSNGKGKVYSDKHIDRNYDLSHSDNIDITRTSLNEYWVYDYNVPTRVISELKDNRIVFMNTDNFNIHELKQYEKMFRKAVDAQNERNVKGRHKERCKDMKYVHSSTQTCPEETLTYFGSKDSSLIPKKLLLKMHDEIITEITRRYGTHIKYLASALHMDELGAPHFHDRRVWVYEGKDGLDVGQRKALQALGVKKSTKRVRADGKEYTAEKYNNEKVTFTEIERQIKIEIAKKYGLEIIENPLEPGKYQKSQDRYIAEKEAERAQLLTQSVDIARAELTVVQSEQQDIVEAAKEAVTRVRLEENKLAIVKDNYKTLSEVADQRKNELVMIEVEKALQEKELEELRQKNCAVALSQKEYQKKQKELKKILIRDKPISVNRYEYERLLAANRTAEDLIKREKELTEKEKSFAIQVQEAVRKRFPEELQIAREDKAYCDEWLSKARGVEKKEKELLGREENVSWRERTLEAEAENRAQDLFRELRDNSFEKMREKLLNLKNSVLNVLDKLLPKVLFAEIRESISKVFNNFEKQIAIDNEEIDTEIEKEEVDI
jgi:hypothetical protein